ncbi:MAG: polynucleotide kinase [Anaerolineae bacterium]|nr:polynucleotide kinase [Anaerolineae bacterium]MCI0607769.1 polynucleotide kinase [Anaerolineae bacterium]
MTEEIVIFDIDGTLADVSERIHHVKKKPKDWDAFFKGIPQDKAIQSMVRLCNILHSSGIRILLCSGRREQDRPKTIEWLAQQGVNYHELILRRDGDRRSDVIVKREMLSGLDRSKILFVVEDRSGVVEMWRSEGLVCLQCASSEF